MNAIKIDVEGFESDVLRGARRLLFEYRPDVYIECLTYEEFVQAQEILLPYGYLYNSTYNNSPTHLFTHIQPGAVAYQNAIDAAIRNGYDTYKRYNSLRDSVRDVNVKYRNVTKQVEELRNRITNANKKYRAATSSLQDLKVQMARTTVRYEQAANQLDCVNLKYRSVTKKVEELRNRFADANKKYRATTSNLQDLKVQMARATPRYEQAANRLDYSTAESDRLTSRALTMRRDLAELLSLAGAHDETLAELAGLRHELELLLTGPRSTVRSLQP